ncbi:MAG TPA: YdjY domain-containing protein [Verrucomicrobiae bacterium]
MKRLACGALILCGQVDADILTNPPVRELGNGRLQIGQIEVDAKAKAITFAAVINMRDGVVEYLVVNAKGKVHESLLRTDIEPFHIHTAMLLLGAKTATNSEAAAFFDPKREIPGPKITIEVALPPPEKKGVEIETLLAFAESKRPVNMNDLPHWIYNGSRFTDTPGLEPVAAGAPQRQQDSKREAEKVFMAQREGSIVSLIADPNALVNNPRKDRENDELWILNTEVIPPVGTPVQVSFKLE